ncbi:dihydroneopterin aldolase [Azospirillum sp. HJ39]|uniref:dihydroneopterin aldolase n=1 Tax=Azospirillum sp. HJ39 TaxID=3159496 RepID=UPI00355868A3
MPDDTQSGYRTIMNVLRPAAPANAAPTNAAPTNTAMRRYDLVLHDYVGDFRIGVWDHEKTGTQRVRVNLAVTVEVPNRPFVDDLDAVVSYEYLIHGVEAFARSPHIQLLEVLAEKLLALCLSPPQAVSARVQVEKLEIVPRATGVGVVLTGTRAVTQ